MAASLTRDIGKGGGLPPTGSGWGGGGGSPHGHGASRRASFTGLWVLLAAIVMFFAALVSVYVVRRGISDDWVATPLPPLIWWSTGILLASSAALEFARRALRNGRRVLFNGWWLGGTALGLGFLAAQYMTWQALWRGGYYMESNPSSAMFYVLTAAHGAHLLGGIIALLYVALQAVRLRLGPGKRTIADVSTAYWHFMDGLWIFLLVLFLVRG